MEYFCNACDTMWKTDNETLIKNAAKELEHLGLAKASDVVDGTVIRQPKAYPVYDGDYQDALAVIRDWLGTIENLQAVGRNGMHRYNNQDHSMLTAMLAVENIYGANKDLWSVNVERSYHEEFEVAADKKDAIQIAELEDVHAAQMIASEDIEQIAQGAGLAPSTGSEQAARTIAA